MLSSPEIGMAREGEGSTSDTDLRFEDERVGEGKCLLVTHVSISHHSLYCSH